LADGLVVLFGGPAGAGKSTLARAWCESRPRAVHIELDAVRSLIVGGFVDPQEPGAEQSRQYEAAVRACCALARSYIASGFDVALDDVLTPEAFEARWRRELVGLRWQVLIILPSLDEVLRRSRRREKRVEEDVIAEQHAMSLNWPAETCLDTTGLSIDESLALARKRHLLP
jgi:predicted kinase